MSRCMLTLLALSMVAAASSVSSAQTRQPLDFGSLSHGAPAESIEQRLQRHNVVLTEAGLLRALHQGDFEVRWLAAYELFHVYGRETIPVLVEALAVEKDPLTHESIANLLAQGNDAHGLAALRTMCADPGLEAYWRVKAASDLLNLGDQSCLSAVVDVLREEAKPNHRDSSSHLMEALSLLSHFEKLAREDSSKLAAAAAESLRHADPLVRTAAGRALASLGDASAIPYLQTAVAGESNPGAASELRASLNQLVQKEKNSQ